MQDDEDNIFQQEMSGVKPLAHANLVALRNSDQHNKDSSLEERRRAAVTGPEADRNILSDEGLTPLDSWFVLDYKRPGVQK